MAQYLYKITNTINNKSYIGVSTRPEKRFKWNHCVGLGSKEIAKDLHTGHFVLEILACGSASYIYELEHKAILLYDTLVPKGYNKSTGGEVGIPSDGENNGRAKLTEALVIEIRELYAMGYTQIDLAKYFEVSRATIGYIVRGETWPNVAGPIETKRKGMRGKF